MTHIPVLLKEVVEQFNVSSGTKFLDATVGGGGHSEAILAANKGASVLGIDLDQTSLDKLREQLVQKGLGQRIILVQGNYKDIDKIIEDSGFGSVNGIILDLGFSSMQVDDNSRGFSFQTDGPLDMRYDLSSELTAEKVVSSYSPKDLEQVISDYSEDRFARRIAASIIRARKEKPLKTTSDLAEAVRRAIPLPIRFRSADSVRRVFQAIRIEVNRELDNLKEFLPKALAALSPGGRLAIISFHSLEDRIVKEFFNQEAKDCVCPPQFPTCVCDKASTVRVLTRKPIVADSEEQDRNPRSKSAKLRVAEKIKS